MPVPSAVSAAEVQALRLVVGQRLADQLARPFAHRDGALGVPALRPPRAVVRRDDVGVAAATGRLGEKVVVHRALVAEAAVAHLVAKALHLVARHAGRHVGKVDQQAQADIVADRRALGWRAQHGTRVAGSAQRALALAALEPALVAAPPAEPQRAFAPRGAGRLGRDAHAGRHARAAAVGQRACAGQRLQRVLVVGQFGKFEETGGRVAGDRVAVERLEHRLVLVAPAAHLEPGAVGLDEAEGLAEEGGRHRDAPAVADGRRVSDLRRSPGRRYPQSLGVCLPTRRWLRAAGRALVRFGQMRDGLTARCTETCARNRLEAQNQSVSE